MDIPFELLKTKVLTSHMEHCVKYIQEKYNKTENEAIEIFLGTETYQLLKDEKMEMYGESYVFILHVLKMELENKIDSWELLLFGI